MVRKYLKFPDSNFDHTEVKKCNLLWKSSLNICLVLLTLQVVAGTNYVIEFIARETKCSKESNTELTEDCEIKHLGVSSTVPVWHSKVTCSWASWLMLIYFLLSSVFMISKVSTAMLTCTWDLGRTKSSRLWNAKH